MITFCFLAAQGGCEPQLTSHAEANIKIGNDKQFLIKSDISMFTIYRIPSQFERIELCLTALQKNNKKERTNMSKVYFTSDISSNGLMKAYNALGRPVAGKNVAG